MKKAFTLVELIVVITILAILGAIAFISLQGYSVEARDAKRISDVRNILTKINVENARGEQLSQLVHETEKTTLKILGEDDNNVQTFGKANFEVLKENSNDFRDPLYKAKDYPVAYVEGGRGKRTYSFVQIATISEKNNTAIITGNYYTSTGSDAPSLFMTGSSYIENGKDKLPYGDEDKNEEITYPSKTLSWAPRFGADGMGYMKFNDVIVYSNWEEYVPLPAPITTNYGILTVNSWALSTPSPAYVTFYFTYTLTTLDVPTENDEVFVLIKDGDGDSASGTLNIPVQSLLNN